MDLKQVTEQLKIHEGFRNHVYQCSMGHDTQGYGHLVSKGISKEVAEMILQEDIQEAIEEVRRNIGFFDDLPGKAQEALVNMSFNLGISRLMQFKKMLMHLRDRSFSKASDEVLNSRYASQVGKRAVDVATMIKDCEEKDE
jgi:lysozyme